MFPWFAEAYLTEDDVSHGVAINVSLVGNATHAVLAWATVFGDSRHGIASLPNGADPLLLPPSSLGLDNTSSVSCTPRHRTLQSIGGNQRGFAASLPSSVTIVQASVGWALLVFPPLPSYAIEEPEALDLFVPESTLFGTACGNANLVAIGSVRVTPNSNPLGAAEESSMGVSVVGTVAAIAFGAAGLAAEQQGLSAMAMMSCADPHTRAAFGSYRALSPFALWDSYIGVVAGNFVFVAAVLLIQGAVLLCLRLANRVRRWEELSAMARFPSVLLNCSFAIHTGTAYAASQLITLEDRPAEDRVIGALAFAFVVLYPFGLVGFAYKFVGRAYQSYAVADYLEDKKWPAWVTHLLPVGAIYAAETRRTFGPLVSSYRLSGPQWPSYPTWTPMIFAIGGLFHPDTIPKCQALFVCMGLAFVAICVLVAVKMPRRSDAANWVDCTARILSAVVLFCMAIAVAPGDDGRNAALAAMALGFIQTSLTIIRTLYALVMIVFDRRLRELPLTHEWVHYTSEGAKTAKRFGANEDLFDDLRTEAQRRDDGEDAVLVDFDGEKYGNSSSVELKTKPAVPMSELPKSAQDDIQSTSSDDSIFGGPAKDKKTSVEIDSDTSNFSKSENSASSPRSDISNGSNPIDDTPSAESDTPIGSDDDDDFI